MLTNANLKNLLLRGTGDRWYNANQQTKVPLQVSSFRLSCGKPLFEGVGMVENVSTWHFFAPAPFLFAIPLKV